ncbi:phospholipase D-like domain-containing protein [Legionella bononiensis]|uniref:Phosphatidylserine/phosphatidylglycerophosphate/ cardiolipin synthase family protein n=1 Tax=Legionella bononiensis TaxID=2793102 RepID=A0ABS1WCA6_9GAMM|nr:phosphatidylserine/phosphatidylglycerophosphate/cardiolipin synthase family protein [Legionella bononiensis]MBL7481181.1 phosphatidylserine/phosphatidylglycerophosphate/cardiolipin synthase family protein [Legionella bononiensis]MBL7526890.1 phosphatidylserine/phosphatidylglycerophosphate/cardiolipin synthase family protein [Legionella bononiensis]MBL7563804.1 phosphatidylserine/phosphatidylglycerophosphate/cardiolipin synthase family protein [Legionella bononiensis]
MPDKSIVSKIYELLRREKARDNPLVGEFSYSTKKTSEIVSGPYVRGNAMFSNISELIKSANSEVFLCFYKFQNDSVAGLKILDALADLKAKADREQRPIKVKIIINKKTGLSSLIQGDGRKSPIDTPYLLQLNSEHFEVQVGFHEHKAFNSSHSKLVLCDGKDAAILTGDPTFANSMDDKQNWVEVATVCKDAGLVSGFRSQFVSLWNNDTVRLGHSGKKEKLVHAHPERNDQQNDQKNDRKRSLLLSKTPSASPFIRHRSPYKSALLTLLDSSKSSVKIMVNNLNDKDILNALLRCAKRGVQVELLLGRYHGESAEKLPFAGGTNVDSINYLLSKATTSEVREKLSLRWACQPDGTLVQNMSENSIHAKVVIVDESHVLTGSSLMDKQSSRSGESDILFKSKKLARQYINEAFDPIFSIARDAHSHNIQKPLTRQEINANLRKASTKEELILVVKDYIYMREYEDNFTGFRQVYSFFSNQSKFDRKNKIEDAKTILHLLSDGTGEVSVIQTDGLLMEIYDKASSFIRSNPTLE